jgi:hypothetical protein
VSEEFAASVFTVEDGGKRMFRNVSIYTKSHGFTFQREPQRHRLNVLEKNILKRIFISKKEELTEYRMK